MSAPPGSNIIVQDGTSQDGTCQTELARFYTFTAKTCMELLPCLSQEQLDFEYNYFQTVDSDFAPDLISMNKPNNAKKMDAIQKYLGYRVCHDLDKFVNLTSNMSYLADCAQQCVDNLRTQFNNIPSNVPPKIIDQLQNDLLDQDSPPHKDCDLSDADRDPPVCLLDISVSELELSNIMNGIKFTDKLGNRDTAYFGNVEYSYGRVTHKPAPYPQSDFLDVIFNKIQTVNPDFNRTNYTCLVTLYRDGYSTIPPHHDDEQVIAEDSLIYTVSIGQTRTLQLTNTIGPLDKRSYTLDHGSIYTMSRASQLNWLHSINREPECEGARVSFTFRYLVPRTQPVRSEIPPINITPPKRSKRVLLLTDSIISSCPTALFDVIPDHTCIKKQNYQLADFGLFKDEFAYTDYVILSGGVNDLSRHGRTAKTLADAVYKRLSDCCIEYPETKFIFNSILLTDSKYGTLNREICIFNKYMFELACKFDNFIFFDSHQTLISARLERVLEPQGIHITLTARKLVTRELVNCVGYLHALETNSRGSRFLDWVLPLRKELARYRI